jgi:hypothetical protein
VIVFPNKILMEKSRWNSLKNLLATNSEKREKKLESSGEIEK